MKRITSLIALTIILLLSVEGVTAQELKSQGLPVASDSDLIDQGSPIEDRDAESADDLMFTTTDDHSPVTHAVDQTSDAPTAVIAPANPTSLIAIPALLSSPSNVPSVTRPSRASPSTTAAIKPLGAFFGYGIQADLIFAEPNRSMELTKQIGFKWIKQQIEYKWFYPAPGQYDFSAMDRIVDAAQARGLNVMLSIVKAPQWSRPPEDTDEGPPADPNTYADFVRAVAARYAGRVQAYEIWNEQNLYYEWGGLGAKLSPARYMSLLKAAYQAIKSVDRKAIVISGGLTPTGIDDGKIAIDDQKYLKAMYQLGLKYYSDAIGAHPSGYNCPANADWRTVKNPTATFRGPFDNRHPSWCFRGTLEGYRRIMVAYGDARKRIWVTEFGWASVDGLGVAPAAGYEYAGDNTAYEQAAWVRQAYQIGKSKGYVGVMFLWNLNFAPVAGAASEKAAFGIIDKDWQPRIVFAALVNMPK